MKVGFVGTGRLDRPMLRHLVAKGFSVVAYDVLDGIAAGRLCIEASSGDAPV